MKEWTLEIVKEYLKIKYDKPGNVYLGVIHRIDRPTSDDHDRSETLKTFPYIISVSSSV